MRYGDKNVARHIIIQAGGRDLLTAEVTIEPAGTPAEELFDLPTSPAEPGMTLRPIHIDEVREPLSDDTGSSLGPPPRYMTVGKVITRQGDIREMEVFDTPDKNETKVILDVIRPFRYYRPAMIDNKPCEIFLNEAGHMNRCGH